VAGAQANEGDGGARRKVFLSYSGKDRALAEEVREVLTADGHTVWMAPHSIPPGHSYASGIVEGINQAELVFILMTRHSNASAMVEREIERAVGKKKLIVGLRADDFAPTGALEYFLSNVQWVDLTATDRALWADPLCSAARNPEATAPPPPRAGLIAVTSSNLLRFAGAVAWIAALGVALTSVDSPAPGVLLLLGAVLLLVGWFRVRRNKGVRRIAVLRWGDIAVIAALLAAVVAAWFWLLLTPLIAMALLGAMYLALRSRPQILGKNLWRRGALMAVIAGAIFVGAVGWAEMALYNALKPTRVTLALLPEDYCPATDTCRAVSRQLYSNVRDILSDAFENTGVAVYPTGRVSTARYRLLSQTDVEDRARGVTLIESMTRDRDVFDAVLTLQVNYQDVACGGAHALDLAVDLGDWQSGALPTPAFWRTRRSLDWRQFDATVTLDENENSPLLRVATITMVARMLLAAQETPERFGGAEDYERAVNQILALYRSGMRTVPLPADTAGGEAAAALAQASADATLTQRLAALQRIADAYQSRLQRPESGCDTERDTLIARIAPGSQSSSQSELAEPVATEIAAPADAAPPPPDESP